MNNKDLIRQYVSTTGLPIPEYQFNKLNNNLKTSYLRKRLQSDNSEGGTKLEPFELLALPDDTRNNYISNLKFYRIISLLQNSKDPEKIYNILADKGIDIISQLGSGDMNHLVSVSKEPDKIINILLSNKQLISNLHPSLIRLFLRYSNEPNKIINILGNIGKESILNMNSDNLRLLLEFSKRPDKIINILLSNKDFIANLNSESIYFILKFSSKPDKIKAILTKYGKI
jgi:hypothetical protein